jgi:hypothetical protein
VGTYDAVRRDKHRFKLIKIAHYLRMGKYANIFKGAAVAGAGASLGMLPQCLIGITVLVIGFVLYGAEAKKPKQRQHKFKLFFDLALMLLGGVIGLGAGMGCTLSQLMDQM